MRVSLNQVWTRRVLAAVPDLYDRVIVCGFVEQTNGANEWSLRPADAFGDPVQATAADLEAAFSLEQDAPQVRPGDLYVSGEAWL
jgi:hypothetical protein